MCIIIVDQVRKNGIALDFTANDELLKRAH